VAGGRGGIVAVLASVAVVWMLWIPNNPADRFWVDQHVTLAIFAVAAAVTVALAKALRAGILHGVAAEARFRAAQEGALDPFVILDPVRQGEVVVDFRWSYANAAAEKTAPTGVPTLIGRRVTEVFPDETGRDLIYRVSVVLAGGVTDELEVRRVIDGREHWMRSSGVRLGDSVAVTYRDVTEHRLAEQAVRDAAAQMRALMDSLPQLLWSTSGDGACDYLSPQWVQFTGKPAHEHYGDGWLEAVHPQDRDDVRRAWMQAVAGHLPYDVDYRLLRHDGGWRWFNGRASAIRDESGALRRWFGSSTDITDIVEAKRDLEERVAERTRALEASLEERGRAEAALAQAQRLETVGRLTGGVAHDFNNLLTVMIGGLDLILRAPGDLARVKRLAEAALSAGRRGERLTRQLLAFSRRQELKLEVVNVVAVIDEAEPLVRRAVGEAVDLVVRCDPAAAGCRLDPAQFEAALLNLVVNASDAADGRGRIEIEVAPASLAAGQVLDAEPGDYVRVSVSDTGAGMPPEVLERVFEPFFTTKEIGKGTGLGLAQVYGFVKQCGGGVTIESVLGRGTTVALYLPAAAEPAASVSSIAEAAAPAAVTTTGARVLLVEDDAAVRTVAESLLVELGCRVATAADGADALRRLDRGEIFDLMISDIVMPGGMTGVDLARTARSRWPALQIVLTTGYSGGEAPDELGWPVLRKPFRGEQLAEILRRMIGRPAEAAE
jgi:PAS domain S-box-containing protein